MADDKGVIVFGPGGCGKSHNAEALRQHFGLQHINHEWDGRGVPDVAPATLVLTSADLTFFSHLDFRTLSFVQAMQEAGLSARAPEPIEEAISPWMPEQDRIRLAVLGKLIEECNELAGRAARCIIQGLDEIDPGSGRSNRNELARETSDVIACIEVLGDSLSILPSPPRVDGKANGFRRWHGMIREAEPK